MTIKYDKFQRSEPKPDIDPMMLMASRGIVPVQEVSDTAESLRQLNDDAVDPVSKMSAIDTRSRLHNVEISSILVIDTWVTFGALPLRCLDFTTRKKRLVVSLRGEGRKEMVQLVAGKAEKDQMANKSMFDRIKSAFTPAPRQQQQ